MALTFHGRRPESGFQRLGQPTVLAPFVGTFQFVSALLILLLRPYNLNGTEKGMAANP